MSDFEDIWRQGNIRERELRVVCDVWYRRVTLAIWLPLVVGWLLQAFGAELGWVTGVPLLLSWPYPMWRWHLATKAHIQCMKENIDALQKSMMLTAPELPPELLDRAQQAGRQWMRDSH